MIADEMIVEEVDHAIEIEKTIVSIMMDTIEEAVDMMIVEGLILKICQWGRIELDFWPTFMFQRVLVVWISRCEMY